MSFDGLMFRRVSRLLNDMLVNCNINRISQLSASDFIIALYRKDFKDKLVISTNNNASYITVSSLKYNDLLTANHFVNILRHHLENGVIQEIKQMGLDRIMQIKVSACDELGDYSIKYLYIELTGKMTNIILTKEDNIILDSLHRLGPITQRTIMPGALYHLPPTPNLKDPLIENYDPSVELIGQYYGFSKNLEKEVRYRLGHGENFKDIITEILTSSNIYAYKNDYHLIPFKHLNEVPSIYTWNDGLVTYYLEYQKQVKHKEAIKDLMKVVKKETKRLSTKIGRLNDELDKADDAEKYLNLGNILFTFCPDLDKKLNQVTVTDYDQKQVVIPLDEKITIKNNAQKFFKKYQKLKTSKSIIAEQISLAQTDLDYFEALNVQIEDASKFDLEQIKTELTQLGYLGGKTISKGRKKEVRYLPQVYTLSNGVKISIGMNNLQNEYLTNKLAKYNEFFFHVKDYHGAHVIVHQSDNLSETTIRFAANLAAYYSKARLSSTVPVNYSQVKNVKKIPGGKPGMVILKNYKTIYIDPTKPTEKAD